MPFESTKADIESPMPFESTKADIEFGAVKEVDLSVISEVVFSIDEASVPVDESHSI